MIRVRMKKTFASNKLGTCSPGHEINLPDEVAQQLIDTDQAVRVDASESAEEAEAPAEPEAAEAPQGETAAEKDYQPRRQRKTTAKKG